VTQQPKIVYRVLCTSFGFLAKMDVKTVISLLESYCGLFSAYDGNLNSHTEMRLKEENFSSIKVSSQDMT
jgi:hypothetical protein